MEEFIIWLEKNVILVMIAIAVVMILLCLIVAIIKGSKINKQRAKEEARAEGEKTASIVFAEKEEIVSSEIEEVKETEETQPEIIDKKEVVEETPETVVEEKEEKVVVKAKTKTTKRESTFSPRKKSVTVIDPEYVTAKKEKVQKTTKTKQEDKNTEEKLIEQAEPNKDVVEEKTTRASGAKWEIHKNGSSFYYLLRASNGEVLATSEAYSTEDGAKNGVNTLKKNVDGGEVRIEEDKNDNYCFKLTSRPPFPRLLCVGQSYKYRKSAEGSFEAVKRLCMQELPVVSLVGEEDSDHFEEVVVDVKSVEPSNLPGKWEIVERENGKFGVVLRASNGVLVLNGEPRATEDGCLDYIERIKKNLKVGSVKVQEDKNGQFCYKLYSAQKRIICVGEKYSTVQSAISSAESLARFAENATIINLTSAKDE